MDWFALALSFLFPLGIWFGIEGYELVAMFCLLVGWVPIGSIVGRVLSNNNQKENRNE